MYRLRSTEIATEKNMKKIHVVHRVIAAMLSRSVAWKIWLGFLKALTSLLSSSSNPPDPESETTYSVLSCVMFTTVMFSITIVEFSVTLPSVQFPIGVVVGCELVDMANGIPPVEFEADCELFEFELAPSPGAGVVICTGTGCVETAGGGVVMLAVVVAGVAAELEVVPAGAHGRRATARYVAASRAKGSRPTSCCA